MSTTPSAEQKRLASIPVFKRTLRGATPLPPKAAGHLDEGWEDRELEDVLSSAPPPAGRARPRHERTVQRPLGRLTLSHGTPNTGVHEVSIPVAADRARGLPSDGVTRIPPPSRAPRDEAAATVLAMPALHIVREGDPDSDAAFEAAAAEAAALAPELADVPPERALVLARTAPHADARAPGPYADYEALGMPAPAAPTNLFGKLIVSGYRTLGFAILTIIVVMLVAYISEQIFYFTSHSWVAPTVVSPSDDKIVALRTELAAQQNLRDKIVADLDDAERGIVAEGAFQTDFAAAIKADLAGRKAALGRVQSLVGAAYATRHEILATNKDYAGLSADRLKKESDAGLIDRNGVVTGSYQLAQISSANLSLAEREAELDGQAADLGAQAKALDALLAGSQAGKVALSYDVLKIKHDYETSKLALARANETRDMLKRSLARQDAIIGGLAQSAYLRALDDHATVALVPYENLDHVAKGTPLYGCHVGMVLCRQVGTVLAVVPGEVQFKHPHRDVQERGQLVELELSDPGAAQDTVLFAGGAPLGL